MKDFMINGNKNTTGKKILTGLLFLASLFLSAAVLIGSAGRADAIPFVAAAGLLMLVAAYFFLSAIFALSDEIHQIFVKGRSFEVKDIATDTLGAFCGSVIYIIVYVFAKSLHKNRNLEIQ